MELADLELDLQTKLEQTQERRGPEPGAHLFLAL